MSGKSAKSKQDEGTKTGFKSEGAKAKQTALGYTLRARRCNAELMDTTRCSRG